MSPHTAAQSVHESERSRVSDALALGQSLSFHDIRPALLTSDEFERVLAEDGRRGVTSNPAIVDRAIVGLTGYGQALAELLSASPAASPIKREGMPL